MSVQFLLEWGAVILAGSPKHSCARNNTRFAKDGLGQGEATWSLDALRYIYFKQKINKPVLVFPFAGSVASKSLSQAPYPPPPLYLLGGLAGSLQDLNGDAT